MDDAHGLFFSRGEFLLSRKGFSLAIFKVGVLVQPRKTSTWNLKITSFWTGKTSEPNLHLGVQNISFLMFFLGCYFI